MKTILIAAAALTVAFGASNLTASAQSDDYGQHVYTQNEPSRFAPAGLGSDNTGGRDTSSRDRINAKIDAYARQW